MLGIQKLTSSKLPVLRWDNLAILLVLLALTGLAWSDIHSQSRSMGSMSMPMDQRSFWEDAALFLPHVWVVMMSAMMLPATLPVGVHLLHNLPQPSRRRPGLRPHVGLPCRIYDSLGAVRGAGIPG